MADQEMVEDDDDKPGPSRKRARSDTDVRSHPAELRSVLKLPFRGMIFMGCCAQQSRFTCRTLVTNSHSSN